MSPRACLLAVFALSLSLSAAAQRPWSEDVMYFALTDRFCDGDPANNVQAGSDPAIYDQTQSNIDKYHGGDLRGLELAIQSGYFTALGVTALWITPPVRNVWYSPYDLAGPKTGYHGYWAQDFLDVDPHLTSRRSLDGKREYPDTRDGRMQHYKDFVALAHSRGMKVVQDIVLNHAGPVFYYDVNGNERFDEAREESIAPFKRDGFHQNARWLDIPKWNMARTAPTGPATVLGQALKTSGALAKLENYGRKGMSGGSLGASDGEEIDCDFFSLRDFWTAPGSAQFDAVVNEFVEIYAFYVEQIGVDGFHIDTIKHVHREFWDAFTERLRKRVGPERAKRLILFGEVYEGSAAKIGSYTYRADWPQRREPSLDSVLHFPFCFSVRGYLRSKEKPFGNGRGIESAWRDQSSEERDGKRALYNPTPGPDGLDARQKMINFVENHDGLNRFRVQGVSERHNQLANALLLLAPGIPCLYYGTEADLHDTRGKIGDDSETGRLTFVAGGDAKRFTAARQTASFKMIAEFAELRRKLPALEHGAVSPLWADSDSADADDGVFAFARGDGADAIIVVCNASDRERVTGVPGNAMRLVSRTGQPLVQRGDKLARVPLGGRDAAAPFEPAWREGIPHAELRVAPESIQTYRILR